MRYTSKELHSKPGLPREAALAALRRSPSFTKGSKIESFKKAGNRWVAKVKLAEFPPKDEEDTGSDEPVTPDKSDDEDKNDAPPFGGGGDDKPKGDKPPKKDKGDDLGGDGEVVGLLKQILEALGGGAPDLGGDIDLGIGDELSGLDDGPVPPPPGDLGLEKGPKPPKGGKPPKPAPTGDDQIPTFASLQDQFKAVAGKLPTVVISRPDAGQSIKQAKTEIEAAGQPFGYRVAKAVREDGKLRVVATVR